VILRSVKFKPQPWQLIVAIAAFCGLSVGAFVWYHSTTLTPAALLKRMPASDSLVMWIDFASLRRAGFLQLLSGAKSAEDPEYQSFVYATRFDYMSDLDSALAAFSHSGGKYFLLSGRFDWKSLRNYVTREHGECINSLCRVVGSEADRHISFLPLRRDLMAMAVSPEPYAVNDLSIARPGPNPKMPEGLVWLRFPGWLPKYAGSLPDGMRPFARIVENSPSVTVSFVPDGDRLAAKLEIQCRSPLEAADLVTQFSSVTETARSLFAREHQTPNPADFSGIVTSGSFRSDGARLEGTWPIARAFVQNLLGTK